MASSRWLTHHDPEHQDRCVHLGPVLVCGRCVVLYPIVLATAILTVAADVRPDAAIIAAMWLLPVPMVIEWIAEHAGVATYVPWRQRLLTALAAPGFGLALGEHLRHPFTLVAVLPVLTWVVVCAASALWSAHTASTDDTWEAEYEQAEAARRSALEALLGSHDDPARRG
jgi:hypothetical protein